MDWTCAPSGATHNLTDNKCRGTPACIQPLGALLAQVVVSHSNLQEKTRALGDAAG